MSFAVIDVTHLMAYLINYCYGARFVNDSNVFA